MVPLFGGSIDRCAGNSDCFALTLFTNAGAGFSAGTLNGVLVVVGLATSLVFCFLAGGSLSSLGVVRLPYVRS